MNSVLSAELDCRAAVSNTDTETTQDPPTRCSPETHFRPRDRATERGSAEGPTRTAARATEREAAGGRRPAQQSADA